MEGFTLRHAGEGDYPALIDIWRRVYGESASPENWVPEEPFQQFYIGEKEGVPGFAAVISEYPTLVRGKVLRCAGVGAVATVPEMRNAGLAQYSMGELNRACLQDGFQIASLYGFRDSFYRKFGYESCGWRWEFTCSADRFPKVKSDLPVRLISPEGAWELDDCFRAHIGRMSGGCVRTSEHWRRRLGRNPQTIYAVGDPVEGYLWTDAGGFWTDLNIGEIGWSTQRGYEGLLALIRGLATNKGNVVWNEPPNSMFLAQYMDCRVEAKISRHSMYRVLDVPGVLAEFGVGLNEVGLRIYDPDIEWSQSVGSGPEVSMSIGAFSQGLMGTPSFGELAEFGVIQGSDDGIAALRQKMSAVPVCCTEFF